MDYKFKKCMEERKLVKTKPDKGMIDKELKGVEYDIMRAENSLAEQDYKWAIIHSYYSIFHAVKALVLSKGYVFASFIALYLYYKVLNLLQKKNPNQKVSVADLLFELSKIMLNEKNNTLLEAPTRTWKLANKTGLIVY